MAFDEAIAACLRDTTPAALIALGHIDDPRAVVLLLQCVRFRDWRVRLMAVRSLAGHDDPVAVAAVERSSKEDCSLPVRVEAALAVFRRDRARGKTLLTSMLAHPHVTPSLSALINGALRGET
ncbi:HEAT repeat domain-containing protein [Catelliglobosispora koreensis]|uniref:HEAT repeat domain-containing protein n=1 Tax=Catelliglobosispora koreensis TaxID=129052 RepID=UPI000362D64E|nr:HEAT repeat domain-containing protein [Catelliglobosispora koreensis]